jgi:hypothetical protein
VILKILMPVPTMKKHTKSPIKNGFLANSQIAFNPIDRQKLIMSDGLITHKIFSLSTKNLYGSENISSLQ